MALETYEVWMRRPDGKWRRLSDAKQGGEDLFAERKAAESVAHRASNSEEAVEVVVIERRPILRLNGKGVTKKKDVQS